jgi:hypothetical protein
MRKISFVLAIPVPVAVLTARSPEDQRPIPPGVREADKQTNAPIEAPLPPRAKARNPGQLQDEAAELAKLSAGIPAEIEHVNQGQLPKELSDQLRRIEKLAKHLRSEVTP